MFMATVAVLYISVIRVDGKELGKTCIKYQKAEDPVGGEIYSGIRLVSKACQI